MPTVDLTPPASVATTPPSDNMEHGVYYAHYLRDSISKPAPSYYGSLIAMATRKIYIWDPYFNIYDPEIFRWLQHEVEVTVLSSKDQQRKDAYLDALLSETESRINTAVRGNCVFNYGFIDKSRYGKEVWNTHDRFLIIDNRFFLIGASVAHHISPHDSTGIYEVTEQADKDVIWNAFNQCWQICVNDSMYKSRTI